MHIPDCLATLFDAGIIERVVRPLMSGKEAQVYLVVSHGVLCVAKVYKEAHNRTFKNRAEYTEGRTTRNSRDQRAIEKRSKHGREQDEAAWRSTEVDMIRKLHAGGVRVPIPHAFLDGVLVMECIVDAEGNPAPRLGDVPFDRETAQAMYQQVLREVVRMLAVGVVHGDLSDFNVLVGSDGPVIIDFPQSVDTARNTNARRLLQRDLDNLHRFLTGYVPNAPRLPFADEMWDLHEQNALTADTRLTGRFRAASYQRRASSESVLDLIQDADRDERRRREALGIAMGGPRPPQTPRGLPGSVEGGRLGGPGGQRPPFQPRPPSQQQRPPQQAQQHQPQHQPPQHQAQSQQNRRPNDRAQPYQSQPRQAQQPPQNRHPNDRSPQQNVSRPPSQGQDRPPPRRDDSQQRRWAPPPGQAPRRPEPRGVERAPSRAPEVIVVRSSRRPPG